MKYLITIVLCLTSLVFQGQQLLPDLFVLTPRTPRVKPETTADVAADILARKLSDKEKYRAAYAWVTSNIRYDTDSAFIINAGADSAAKVDVAFKRRKGVCENFAAIFSDICNRAGLETYVVQGYTRNESGVQNGGHTWCAGLQGGEWYLFDPTWDAGGGTNFFMVEPVSFIQTHMPFDPIWQLLKFPISNADFVRGNFSRSWTKTALNYKDSINAFLQMEKKLKLLETEKRIQEGGLVNSQLKTSLAVIQMEVEMARQEEQVIQHDSAVNLVNSATEKLNSVIKKWNDGILTTDWDVQLAIAAKKLNEALFFLDKIDHSKAKLVMGTWPVRDRIRELQRKISDQKEFFRNGSQ